MAACSACSAEFDQAFNHSYLCPACRQDVTRIRTRKKPTPCMDCGRIVVVERDCVRCGRCRRRRQRERDERQLRQQRDDMRFAWPDRTPAVRYRQALERARAAGVSFGDAVSGALAFALEAAGDFKDRAEWRLALLETGPEWGSAFDREPGRPLLNHALLDDVDQVEPAVGCTILG